MCPPILFSTFGRILFIYFLIYFYLLTVTYFTLCFITCFFSLNNTSKPHLAIPYPQILQGLKVQVLSMSHKAHMSLPLSPLTFVQSFSVVGSAPITSVSLKIIKLADTLGLRFLYFQLFIWRIPPQLNVYYYFIIMF